MNMELNKVFAALLTAGIIAYLCWFAASHILYPLEEHESAKVAAYPIEGGAEAAATPVATGPEPLDMKLGSVEQGAKISAVCSSCHSFGKGEAAKVGPNLFGIVGSKHAHMDGFAYSDAMKAKSGDKWTPDALNDFLWNPQKTIQGTKMTFMGLKKPEERASIIKWLETQK